MLEGYQRYFLYYCIIESVITPTVIGILIYGLIVYKQGSFNEECCKVRHSIVLDIAALICGIMAFVWDWVSLYKSHVGVNVVIFGIVQVLMLFVAIWIGKYTEYMYNLYFETQFSEAVKKHQWRKVIDNTHEANFFIKYKNKWGNINFTNKITHAYLVFQYVPLFISWTLLTFSNNEMVLLFANIILFIFCGISFIQMIAILYLYRKIKSFNDVFLIRKQLKLNSRNLLIGIGLWCIGQALWTFANTEALTVISTICLSLGLQYGPFGFVFVNTYWVLKYVISIKSRKNSIRRVPMVNEMHIEIALKDILSNSNAMNLFMSHLSDEFSTEILASYLEFYEFRLYSAQMLDVILPSNENEEYIHAPRSWIISTHHKNENLTNGKIVKHIIYDLYSKYIMRNSKYEINIDWDERRKLNIYMKTKEYWLNLNITNNELVHIFDKCISEMYQLMRYSLDRAKNMTHFVTSIEECLVFNNDQT